MSLSNSPDPHCTPYNPNVIELKDIAFARGGKQLLDGFSWQLPDPGVYLLLGPNASGKSLLTGILTGRVRPNRGEVLVDGESVHSLIARYNDPILSADAAAACRESDPLDLYLEAELSGCGGSVRQLKDLWPLLEDKLGLRRTTPLNQLAHGEVLLAQVALAGLAPVRLAVLDGHLTYLDRRLLGLAERLLNLPGHQDKFVVLTASRLADYFPRARGRFLLSGTLPAQLTELGRDVTLDTALEPTGGGLLRVKTVESPYARGGIASGDKFTIVSSLEDGYRIEPHGGIDAVVAEFERLGLAVRAVEWEREAD